MKVAQTCLSAVEYEFLVRYAKHNGIPLQEALREDVRRLVMDYDVNKDDPIFKEMPAIRRGKKEKTSVDHDKVLYGGSK